MAKSKHYYIRKSHRFLGLILGIQFLMWTVSGIYFSWTDIDEIHGDFQHRHMPHLMGDVAFVSPDSIIKNSGRQVDSIHSLQLVSILGKPFFNLHFFSGGQEMSLLADAESAKLRSPITKEEAIQIAAESFTGEPRLKSAAYITSTDGHHEYRSKPLPAWAVTFDHPTNTTIYISAATGKVESFRNNKWRIFDFLWMGHTMDYNGRDNFNNWLLRIFSAFGLITILSGFLLFWVSSRWVRKVKVQKFSES